MKKCPPGVICIENYAMFFIVVSVCGLGYVAYHSRKNKTQDQSPDHASNPQVQTVNIQTQPPEYGGYGFGGLGRMFVSTDPLVNPYTPPLANLVGIPTYPLINVATNLGAVSSATPYRQVGVLSATNTQGKVLALMGRPVFTNRDKWQYYTMTGHNNIKLPISRNGKSGMNEYGVDSLSNGDTVYVEGIHETYRVTIYDNDTLRYL